MPKVSIYHNPNCSKSRQTLALLEERGIDPLVVLYLENPPTEAELKATLAKLGISPRDLMRKGEQIYQDMGLEDADFTDEALIAAMLAHPILIERPVVITETRAKIGRPPESVLDIIDL